MNWLSYPRALIMVALYPFVLWFFSVFCILQNLLFNRRDWDDAVVRAWGRVSCAMFGVKVKVEGRENLPAGGCIFLFNHSSFFDIFTMAAVFPGLRYGAKIELFRIPVFGFAMRRVGILPIDRGRREKTFGVYREAHDRLEKGERFALAPEGTRQDEERLGPFKAGPFVFAINTGAPVVPLVIKNASRIMPKHSLFPNWGVWSREVRLIILPPVSATDYVLKDRPQLQERVRRDMQPYLS
ncbi:MAG: 1-acyl-sn-glycerol-3-phosphate acyltransferase [Bdellovibrionaceae bacterium]|nr:1-acyl-sn-glycerol-3-phosphate acyltransferase [Pseudobdellovibrionaceae bacterium]MBX3034746.1 1-acyl-sn-glycerol-3-phosphate acyltransferase [Pseudobdellovibrionaceae bacterium]